MAAKSFLHRSFLASAGMVLLPFCLSVQAQATRGLLAAEEECADAIDPQELQKLMSQARQARPSDEDMEKRVELARRGLQDGKAAHEIIDRHRQRANDFDSGKVEAELKAGGREQQFAVHNPHDGKSISLPGGGCNKPTGKPRR